LLICNEVSRQILQAKPELEFRRWLKVAELQEKKSLPLDLPVTGRLILAGK